MIGEDPGKFFDPSCIPSGFKFQDPSRMGITVKLLLSHLRARQEMLGVDAFQFHHVLQNNKVELAEYPSDTQDLGPDAAGIPTLEGLPTSFADRKASLVPPTPSRKKSGAKTPDKTPRKQGKKSRKTSNEATGPDVVSLKFY